MLNPCVDCSGVLNVLNSSIDCCDMLLPFNQFVLIHEFPKPGILLIFHFIPPHPDSHLGHSQVILLQLHLNLLSHKLGSKIKCGQLLRSTQRHLGVILTRARLSLTLLRQILNLNLRRQHLESISVLPILK